MNDISQIEKRDRASKVQPGSPEVGRAPLSYGPLQVQFESAFDRACYVLSRPGFGTKHPAKFSDLATALGSETGCTAEELLDHGEKVRARLWFALDFLKRAAPVETNTSYALSATIPAF